MRCTAGALQNKKGYENGFIVTAAAVGRISIWPILKHEDHLSYSSEAKLARMERRPCSGTASSPNEMLHQLLQGARTFITTNTPAASPPCGGPKPTPARRSRFAHSNRRLGSVVSLHARRCSQKWLGEGSCYLCVMKSASLVKGLSKRLWFLELLRGSLQMFLGSFFLMESAVPSFLRAASSHWLHICQYSTYTLQSPPFCTLSGIYRTYTERSLGARNGAKNRILISFNLHNGL